LEGVEELVEVINMNGNGGYEKRGRGKN